MRVAIYSTRPDDRQFLARANDAGSHQLVFIVSLHYPLTPQSRHLIDAAVLTHMKRGKSSGWPLRPVSVDDLA